MRWALPLAALQILGACSLFDPHVEPSGPSPRFDGMDGMSVALHGDLPRIMDYGLEVQAAYRQAVSEHSVARNLLAVGTLGLSATAFYYAVNNPGATNSIVGMGLGAASLYGGGQLLISAPRQAVYLSGHRAAGCILLAYSPLLVTKAEFEGYAGKLTALATSAYIADTLFSGDQRIGELVETAFAKWHQGESLRGAIEAAPATLLIQLDTLIGRVSEEVLKTEPDLAAIQRTAFGVGALAGTYLDQVAGFRPSLPGEDGAMDLAGTPPPLPATAEAWIARLAADIAAVEGLIRRVGTAADAVTQAGACEATGPGTPLRLTPAAIGPFPQGAASTARVAISGGQPPYFAELVGFPLQGISIRGPGINERGFDIAVAPEAVAGSYSVRLTDAVGTPAVLTFSVAQQVASRNPQPPPAPPVPIRPVTQEPQEDDTALLVLTALCLTPAAGADRQGLHLRQFVADYYLDRPEWTGAGIPLSSLTIADLASRPQLSGIRAALAGIGRNGACNEGIPSTYEEQLLTHLQGPDGVICRDLVFAATGQVLAGRGQAFPPDDNRESVRLYRDSARPGEWPEAAVMCTTDGNPCDDEARGLIDADLVRSLIAMERTELAACLPRLPPETA